jgi:hypothetical protein
MATKKDISNFLRQIRNAVSGNMDKNRIIKVTQETPFVYISIGMSNKPLGLTYKVLSKINLNKHNVPLDIVEDLPELIEKPVIVIKSKTEPDSYVSVIKAKDNSGRQIVAILRGCTSKYNMIPSIYGKDHFDKFINASIMEHGVLYIDEKVAPSVIRPSSLQLLGVYNRNLSRASITEKD